METFKDLKGRQWELSITVSAIKRVRSALHLDITNLGEDGFIGILANDPEKMVDMFWVLLKAQAQTMSWREKEVEGEELPEPKVGVDEVEFGEGFAGDVIDEAVLAFTEELTNFFPEKKREATRKLFTKTGKVVEKGFQKIETEIDNMNVDEILDKAFSKANQ